MRLVLHAGDQRLPQKGYAAHVLLPVGVYILGNLGVKADASDDDEAPVIGIAQVQRSLPAPGQSVKRLGEAFETKVVSQNVAGA
jgi:hypothetical protein